MKVRIFKILKHTKAEGPGTRYCIWFQGCSKHCRGCWAKATWDFNAGIEYEAEDIIEDIKSRKNSIEGVTFLGGEPFEQPQALEFLAKEIQKAGLSVLCFTGKNFEEVQNQFPEILKHIDILIDGEFQEEKTNYSRPWVGSSNQNYYFLTERYEKSILSTYKNKIEINVQKNGSIFINGMGDFKKLTKKLKMYTKH